MVVSKTSFIVRYVETDNMGIVHHSNYPIWYEIGRTEFLRQLGVSYREIEEKGLLFPLLELKCTYKSFAKYEDEILVKTCVKEVSNIRFTFYYEIFKNSEKSAINFGETTHIWTNLNLKPINIKKHDLDLYNLIKNTK